MRHETIQTLKDEDFKRSTGVGREMFEKMLTVVKAGLRDFGRTPKLIREDQLLTTLIVLTRVLDRISHWLGIRHQ